MPLTTEPSSRWTPLLLPLAASLTLGLAPFVPEPHLLGKLRWIAGGAAGMQAADWFDVVLHGAPWVWLLGASALTLLRGSAPGSPAGSPDPPDAPGSR